MATLRLLSKQTFSIIITKHAFADRVTTGTNTPHYLQFPTNA